MKFCKYCGKQIPKGGTCSCKKIDDDVEDNNDVIIDLGLDETKIIDNEEIKEAEFEESEPEETEEVKYKYCSNCGKKILASEICDCIKEETIQDDIANDSVKPIQIFLNNFFKKPNEAIQNYIKSDNTSANILLIIISIVVLSFTMSINSIISSSIINYHFGTYFVNLSPVMVIMTLLKNIIKVISFIVIDIVVSYAVLKHIFNMEKINIKDTFSLVSLSFIPVILFSIIAFLLGLVNSRISGYILNIGYIANILIMEHGIRYCFKMDDDKIFKAIMCIFSLTSLLFFVIILIVN